MIRIWKPAGCESWKTMHESGSALVSQRFCGSNPYTVSSASRGHIDVTDVEMKMVICFTCVMPEGLHKYLLPKGFRDACKALDRLGGIEPGLANPVNIRRR